jgi:hypothetical protein
MDGYRRAALALHGLAGPDQRWMLAQLPANESARISALLGELGALGIPADPTLPAALAERAEAAATASARLRAAPASRVVALLEREPAVLIAALLHIEAWPWRDAVRQALKLSAEPGSVSPQLAAALVSAMEERLEAAERAPQPRRTWSFRLRRRA